MSTEIIVALITGFFGSIVTPLIANFLDRIGKDSGKDSKDADTRKRSISKSSGSQRQTAFFSIAGMVIGIALATGFFSIRDLATVPPATSTPHPDILVRVVHTDAEIDIDGSLDEAAWSAGVSSVYATHPEQNGSSTATVRFLWNGDYLYIAFDVSDTQVETADLSSLWDGDSVSLLVHDGGIAEYRQSLGAQQNENKAYQLKPLTTLNEPADIDAGYIVEMRVRWQETPLAGKRIPGDLLSVDHDANPGAAYDAPGTIFSKLSWDGDGDITSPGVRLLLVDGDEDR